MSILQSQKFGKRYYSTMSILQSQKFEKPNIKKKMGSKKFKVHKQDS
jgi:hypothetical protein